jgi:hypothetical protein
LAVNPGEYLEVNGTIYGVAESGNCSWWSDSNCWIVGFGNYSYASLQQVNQIDGSFLWQDPPYNTNPVMPNMTGNEGLPITYYATWPRQQADHDGDGVADNVDNCPRDANADQADNDRDGFGNACYPVDKLLASDGAAYDLFGSQVAISGNFAIIGAIRKGSYTGAAYIFKFDGSGWREQQRLLAADTAAHDAFGASVAIFGNNAIVGARQDDDKGAESGSAYVYHFDGTNWLLQQKLTASDGEAKDFFGSSVTISSTQAFISTQPLYNGNTGSVYVYQFDGSNWVEQQKLTAPLGSFFGASISTFGNRLAVASSPDGYYADAVHIFDYNETGWVEKQRLVAPDGDTGDRFGISVAISGNNVIIGSPIENAAYLYHHDGSGWVLQKKLLASNPWASNFGDQVSISGNYAIVGAKHYLVGNAGVRSRVAYVYRFDGGSWGEERILGNFDPESEDFWGHSVAVSGDKAIVGVMDDDDNGIDSGAVYIYQLPTAIGVGAHQAGKWYLDFNLNAAWEPNLDVYNYFGASDMLPLPADWNGDGYTEIAVYRAGNWYFDLNGNGVWDGEPADRMVNTWGGEPDDIPVVGDWNGDGVVEIGIYRSSIYTWYLDYDGDAFYDPAVDISQPFGFAGAIPVVGDWNGNGRDKIGVYFEGQWYLDTTGNFVWDDYVNDTYVASFGVAGMLPVIGDWNGSGVDRIGAYRDGQWYLDQDGNGSWNPALDKEVGPFGVSGMLPLVGKW